MGRTSKFSFPVPGRRQKPPPPPSPVSTAPLTKAQKILGTGGLNVDSSTDHSRPRETKSNSRINIPVSESTNDTALGRLNEGEVVNGVSEQRRRWEDESAILPWETQTMGSRGNTAGNDMTTDASSMRRQRSSSTINTYYDKSKVPLSISQQTASSAMAKGLPSKASALLDMDGNFSTPATTKKKKPSRLDLSHLLPKSRSAKHLLPSNAVQKGLVLGPDMGPRPPSMMSISPAIAPAPPPIQQRTDRQPRKKLTLENLREKRHEPVANPVQPVPTELKRRMRTSASANELHNLYEHYEQRSFQEMMGGESRRANTDSVSPTSPTSPTTLSVARGFLSPYSNSTSRAPHSSKDTFNSLQSGNETPTSSLMTPSSLKSPHTDCAASVSSRHTRTSKASKKTDRSMTDLDLRQNSVLSLSSDSEDDYCERPNKPMSTSLSAPRRSSGASRRPSDSQASTASGDLGSFPQPPSPRSTSTGANRKNSLPRRISPMSPMDYSDLAVYSTFPKNTASNPPEVATRTSNLSLSSQGTMKAPSRQSTSHLSIASTATIGSVAPGQKPSPARGSMRAIALIPAQGFPSARRASQLSNASDQLVPPSPTSIDFYMQSQHNSMAFDNGSIRSGKSIGGSSSRRSSVGGNGNDNDGRFIAVTAQEERLLAALRIKRARMRDKIIAEFEEEQDETVDGGATQLHHPQPQHAYDPSSVQHLTNAPPNQPLPAPPKKSRSSSDPKRPSSRLLSRISSFNSGRLAPLPEQPHSETQHQLRPPPAARSVPTSRFATPKTSDASGPGDERILLYKDQPITQLDALNVAQSNPDVGGFIDLDNGSDDNTLPEFPSVPSEVSSASSGSRSRRSQTSSSRSEAPSRKSSLSPPVPKQDSRRTRIDSILTSYREQPAGTKDLALRQRREKKDGHVQVLEDVTEANTHADDGMPRPDSPTSLVPDFPLPASTLPRKKQVRLSAVGYRPMEAGWWADDG